MKLLLILTLTGMIFAPCLFAAEAQKKVYPDESWLSQEFVPQDSSQSRQEVIDVSAQSYPGLNVDLPQLKDRIAVQKTPIAAPTHVENYYQAGGPVLRYWGINTAPSTELVSVDVHK